MVATAQNGTSGALAGGKHAGRGAAGTTLRSGDRVNLECVPKGLRRWSEIAELLVRNQHGSVSVENRDIGWCNNRSGFEEENRSVVDGVFDQDVIDECEPN
jgi:hypothetical protein